MGTHLWSLKSNLQKRRKNTKTLPTWDEYEQRPLRRLPDELSRSTTPNSDSISTPMPELSAKSPSCQPSTCPTRSPVSSPTPWNESRKDQSEVSPSNFKKKNENDETTTFQNSPLSANHWSSMTPPPRCWRLSTSKSRTPLSKCEVHC